MNKKTIIIIASVVGVIFLCVCVVVAGLVGWNAVKTATTEATPEVLVDATPVVDVQPVATKAPAQPTSAPASNTTVSDDDLSLAESAANDYLWALADKDFDKAVTLSDSSLRADATGTAEQLRGLVVDKGLEPSLWEWTSQKSSGGRVQMDAVVNLADNRRGYVSLELMPEGGEWKVNYLDIHTDGDSIDPGPTDSWTDKRTDEELAFARGSANLFIQHWAIGDYETAYTLSSQPMKDQVGSAAKIEEVLGGLGVVPDTWTWNDWSFKQLEGNDSPVIELTGNMNYQSGHTGPVVAQLIFEDGYWSMLYIDVKAQ